MTMKKFTELEDSAKARSLIHHVRFYKLAARSIQNMAFSHIWNKLALSRKDGSIEIWDVANNPCLERVITNTPGNSVEALAWSSDRLFSAGLTGDVIEWNLQTLKPIFKQHVTGNAIWCLDVNRVGTEIAIGTEEGYITIFDISESQFLYKTLLDKQEGRVLCCCYDASGDFLVTGSEGAIRIWNTSTGHAVNKLIPTSKMYKSGREETIIWSVKVLKDMTIIAGDSRGYITIWNGKIASQIESHQVLKADILTVAVDEDEQKFFCAGIEPIIRIYVKTQIKRNDMAYTRWVKFLQRNVHDHDVKALSVTREKIFSGGVDGYLGVSSASKAHSKIVKYGPFLQQPCSSAASKERLLLLRYTNYFEIWSMGSSSEKEALQANPKAQRNSSPINAAAEKLIEYRCRNKEFIECCTLSPNGRWLLLSTHTKTRLFQIHSKGKTERHLTAIKDLPEQFAAASHAAFTSDSMRLIMVNRETKQILVFSVFSPSGEIMDVSATSPLDFVESIDTSKHIKDSIKLFTVSLCGNYIVAASADRTIAVWSVYQGKHFQHLINLPRYTAATTALAIHAKHPRLVAAFADGKIFEYDMEEMCFTCSDIDCFVGSSQNFCITNIVLHPNDPNVFVMQCYSTLFVLAKCKRHEKLQADVMENSSSKSLKKSKLEDNEEIQVDGLILKRAKSYQHLIDICWFCPNELLAICANPVSLVENLPNPFRQKLFGVM